MDPRGLSKVKEKVPKPHFEEALQRRMDELQALPKAKATRS